MKPPADILDLVHTIMHLSRSRQYRDLREGAHDLTHMEIKVMGFFARRPGATQRDLVSHSGKDKAQLARLIQGLRQRALLDAQPDEQDKRVTRLQLSESGKSLFGEVEAQGQRIARLAIRGLSHEEQQTLLHLLQRMQDNLTSE